MQITEGCKVYYRDSYGDRHIARVSYLFTSAQGNNCAYLTDGATKLVADLTNCEE